MTNSMTLRARWLIGAAAMAAVVFPLSEAARAEDPATQQVTGRFVDAATGRPIPSAVFRDRAAKVARDGSFSIAAASNGLGKLSLAASAPGFCMTQGEVLVKNNSVGEVPLVREFVIEGTVLDASGAPLGGAAIGFSGDLFEDSCLPGEKRPYGKQAQLLPEGLSLQRGFGPLRLVSDAAGHFRSQGLVPYEAYTVHASLDGYEHHRKKVGGTGAPGAAVSADLRMLSLARNGRSRWEGLLLVNGAPAAGTITWQGVERVGSVSVGRDGKIDADYMPEGSVEVRVRPNFLSDAGVIGDADDRFAQTLRFERDVDLEQDVALEVPFETIAGRVVDPAGRGVGSVYIGLESSTGGLGEKGFRFMGASSRTAEDGRFVVQVLEGAAQSFDILAIHGGKTFMVKGVVSGQKDILIQTGATGTVRVRVLCDEPISIVDGWTLYWKRRGDSVFQQARGDRGPFSWQAAGWLGFTWPVAAIEYGISVPGAKGALLGEVDVPDGRDISLELPRTGDCDIALGEAGLPLNQDGQPATVILVPTGLRTELAQARSRFQDLTQAYEFKLLAASMAVVNFPRGKPAGSLGRVEDLLPGKYIVTTARGQWAVTPAELVVGGGDSALGPLSFTKK